MNFFNLDVAMSFFLEGGGCKFWQFVKRLI